ncbi:response regulator [soil metagenome]
MERKKILVADDDSSILDVMQILLEHQGFEVLSVVNPEEIESLMINKPDMVFLDIWMAGVSGNEICRKLKAEASTKDIPVVMCSANTETMEIALECGADGFLSKPFEIKELMDMVHKYTD